MILHATKKTHNYRCKCVSVLFFVLLTMGFIPSQQSQVFLARMLLQKYFDFFAFPLRCEIPNHLVKLLKHAVYILIGSVEFIKDCSRIVTAFGRILGSIYFFHPTQEYLCLFCVFHQVFSFYPCRPCPSGAEPRTQMAVCFRCGC